MFKNKLLKAVVASALGVSICLPMLSASAFNYGQIGPAVYTQSNYVADVKKQITPADANVMISMGSVVIKPKMPFNNFSMYEFNYSNMSRVGVKSFTYFYENFSVEIFPDMIPAKGFGLNVMEIKDALPKGAKKAYKIVPSTTTTTVVTNASGGTSTQDQASIINGRGLVYSFFLGSDHPGKKPKLYQYNEETKLWAESNVTTSMISRNDYYYLKTGYAPTGTYCVSASKDALGSQIDYANDETVPDEGAGDDVFNDDDVPDETDEM